MPTLVPVDGDPFASSGVGSTSPKLTPVDHDPFAQPTYWDKAKDMLKSIPTGVMHGLAATAAASGQAEDGMMTGDTSTAPDAQQAASLVEQNVTGKMHAPQTAWGRVGEAGGAALGNPMSYIMPGGVVANAAKAFGTGAASEVGHEAAAGTPYDIPAQLAAPLLLGKVGNIAKSAAGIGKAAAAPTMDELYSTADGQFNKLRQMDLQLHPSVAQNWALPTQAALEARGLDADVAPVTNRTLDKFTAASAQGSPMTANDIMKTRSKLSELSSQVDVHGNATSEAKAAQEALNSFHGLILDPANIPASSVINGDMGAFRTGLQDAVGNWSAARNLDRWGTAMTDAERNAAAANSGKNVGNAYRQSAKKFVAGSAKAGRGLTDDEKQNIEQLIRGSVGTNLLRNVGNRLGGGGGLGSTMMTLGGGIAGGADGGLAGAGLGIAGALARGAYNKSMGNRVQQVGDMIANRSPLALAQALQNVMPARRAPSLSERLLRASIGPEAVFASGHQ